MRSRGIVASILAVTGLIAACGNSTSDGDVTSDDTPRTTSGELVAVDAPGVTDSEIIVGGVASVTNPLGGKYGDAFEGVQAYFDMVNEAGGVHGRQLVLKATRDDKAIGNEAEVQGLLEQDRVFAVLPVATLLFTGADRLVSAGVPTFGWTINPEWEGSADNPKANLFGQAGSFLCLGCEQPTVAWVAKEAGRRRVGLLAYNVPQSARCAEGWRKSFDVYGQESGASVVFSDTSLSYGTTDLSVQVSKMKGDDVDFVVTCMDLNGVVTLAKELKKQRLDAIQYLPNGYDHELLEEYGDLFEGSYAYVSFVPFETDPRPEALEQFFEWMEQRDVEPTENSMVGWLNADLFVKGLEAAGPAFDRQKVVDAINAMDAYDAGGLIPPVRWSTAHSQRAPDVCAAVLRIEDSEFVPIAEEGSAFTCFDASSRTLGPTYR